MFAHWLSENCERKGIIGRENPAFLILLFFLLWVYCISAPTLNPNCDLTFDFAPFAILSLLFQFEASVCS